MAAGPASNALHAPGELLFAYGTLQRGGEYHHLLKDGGAIFIGEAKTTVAYPLVMLDYPCLIDQAGVGHRITGELYRFPEVALWQLIDALEGHPVEYRRCHIDLESDSGHLTAWTYFYQLQVAPLSSLQLLERYWPTAT
jgi:gamma-glutamylcyclotransferase (GGCT)/AIG2-like uncharacterized protein YtfP